MNIQNIWIVIYKMKGERAYILGRYDSEELAKKCMKEDVHIYCEEHNIEILDEVGAHHVIVGKFY